MLKKLELKLPAIPQNVSREMHQYFVELHRNLKKLEEYSNSLQNKKVDK